MNLAEVYDLSTALELDWYENIGLCKPGEAEKLLNDGDTTIGGRVPVNPSGGLGLLRRGHSGAGDRPGLRADLAAPRSGRRPAGRGRQGRRDGESGSVRPRLVGRRNEVRSGTGYGVRGSGSSSKEKTMAEAYIIDAVRTPVGGAAAD